jgi:hypothetical protein
VNPAVASVNWASGVVTGVSSGTTTIQVYRVGDVYYQDSAWASAAPVLTVTVPTNPITYSFATFASIANLRVNFGGGNGSYTVTQFGSRTNLSVDTSPGNYMYLAGTWGASTSCYQPGGYFVIAQSNNPANYINLPYASWFGLLSIGECGGQGEVTPPTGSSIQGVWHSYTSPAIYYRWDYYFPTNAATGTLTEYFNSSGSYEVATPMNYTIAGNTLTVYDDIGPQVFTISGSTLIYVGYDPNPPNLNFHR